MQKLSKSIGTSLQTYIEPGMWDKAFTRLNQAGLISTKQIIDMIRILLIHVENLEQKVEDLSAKEALTESYVKSMIDEAIKAIPQPALTEPTMPELRQQASSLGIKFSPSDKKVDLLKKIEEHATADLQPTQS